MTDGEWLQWAVNVIGCGQQSDGPSWHKPTNALVDCFKKCPLFATDSGAVIHTLSEPRKQE